MEKLKSRIRIIYFIFYIPFIFSGCSSTINNNFCKEILGLNLSLGKKNYTYNEEGVRGKGVLFLEYSFNKKGNNLLIDKINYPHYYDLRENWELSKWNETPLVDERVYKLIDEYGIDDEKFEQYVSLIKEILFSKGSLISYYYKEAGGSIYAIEIYLIDIANDKLYCLYLKV